MKRSPIARRTPLKRGTKRLAPVSKTSKRGRQQAEYLKLRKQFLAEHPLCECCITQQPATDVHHKAGRGKMLCRTEYFMATCRQCHDWIHSHPAVARAQGWLVKPPKDGQP